MLRVSVSRLWVWGSVFGFKAWGLGGPGPFGEQGWELILKDAL